MWENCGVIKNKELLNNGLKRIKNIKTKFKDINIRIDEQNSKDLSLIFELQSSLISSEATIISSLERKESRGAHQRSDFPNLDPSCAFNCLTRLNPTSRKLELSLSPLKNLSNSLQLQVKNAPKEINLRDKLIE